MRAASLLLCGLLSLAAVGCLDPTRPEAAAWQPDTDAGLAGGGAVQFLLGDKHAAERVKEVRVTVVEVTVHSSSFGWMTVVDSRPEGVSCDLLALAGAPLRLGAAPLPPGLYTQARLILAGDSRVTLERGAATVSGSLTVPGGRQTGFKVAGPFEIRSGELTSVVLDFDPEASVVPTGTHLYMLKPVITVAEVGYAPIPPPEPPSDLAASVAGEGPVLLGWRDNSAGEAGFLIERRTGVNGTWRRLDTVGPNTSAYADHTLQALSSYGYRVSAFAGSLASAPSNTAEITVPEPLSMSAPAGGSYGTLGSSVSVSGDLAAAGAPGWNGYRGQVWLFRRSGGSWVRETALFSAAGEPDDRFGSAVSLSGDRLLVGAYLTDRGGTNAGSVYLFENGPSGWRQTAELDAPDASAGDYFGLSVALDHDRALVGAPFDDGEGTNAGAAYVFVRDSGGRWLLEARLSASEAAPGDQFGCAVSLKGARALVGACASNGMSGAAYLFALRGTGWSEEARLTAPSVPAYGLFGYSVALGDDLAVAGACGENRFTGAVYLFSPAPGGWAYGSRLLPSQAAEGDRFGFSVAASGPATVLVGAPGRDGGRPESGAAYLFRGAAGGWQEEASLSPTGAAAFDQVGISVGLDGPHAALGAPGADQAGFDAGAAWLY